MKDLHAALRVLAERGRPIGSQQLRERVAVDLASGQPGLLAEPRQQIPGLVIALAAFTVVLGVGIGLGFLLRSDEAVTSPTPVVPEETPITTPATTPSSPTATRIPAGAELTWTRVEDTTGALSGPGNEDVSQVIPGGPGLVAVGGEWGARQGGAVWLSSDGETWFRVPDPENVFGSGVEFLTGVADDGSRLVAVGIIDTPGGTGTFEESDSRDPRAGVWISDDDGASWTRVPDDETVFGGEMWSVIATDTGFVAAGDNLWTSPDGWEWTRLGPMEEVHRIARTSQGYVAVGTNYTPQGTAAVAWTSPDGISWTPVEVSVPAAPAPGLAYETSMADVVAGPRGVVAVGQRGIRQEAGRYTLDGSVWVANGEGTWTFVEGDRVFAKGLDQEIQAVTVAGDRLVAVGPQNGTMGNLFGPAQSYVSDDGGLTWTAVTGDALGARGAFISMNAVTALDGRVIAMGQHGAKPDWSYDSQECDLAVWIGTWE